MVCQPQLVLVLLYVLSACCHTSSFHLARAESPARVIGYEHQGTTSSAGTPSSYQWFTKPETRQSAQLMRGNQARLRRALEKYHVRGEKIIVAAVGGSVTSGQGAVDAPDYVTWLQTALHAFMDPARVEVHNGGLQGTVSSYMSMCHNVHVPKLTDIVVIEYALNDDGAPFPLMDNNMRRPYERLLRKLMSYPNQPAVVIFNAYRWFQAPSSISGRYWSTAERDFNEFGQYYELPVLSVRSGVYRLMTQGVEGYQVERPRADMHGRIQHGAEDDAVRGKAFFYDVVHPDGHSGHRVMGEMYAQLILDAWVSIQHQGLTPQEVASVAQPLPAPMLENNHAAAVDKCFIGPQFVKTVVNAEGWEWKDEGKPGYPKWGYVATAVGKRIQMRVNTTSPSGINDQPVTVMYAYLKSYEHMGSANVTCEGGCTCEAMTVDGHHEQQNSQLFLAPLPVSQHPECLITLTILPDTKSTGHKFKLAGVMVSDEPADRAFDNWAAVSIVHDAASLAADGAGVYLRKNAGFAGRKR